MLFIHTPTAQKKEDNDCLNENDHSTKQQSLPIMSRRVAASKRPLRWLITVADCWILDDSQGRR